MLYIVYKTPTFSFFTSVLGCGEESAGYLRQQCDEDIHKQKYFLFVWIIGQFKRFLHIKSYGNSIYILI